MMEAERTMRPQDIVLALGLPDGCRVDQRVPKKLLLENGAPTAADKRLINDGIEEIQWVAALKPNTIGVSDYRDDLREYLEIAVLTVTLRGASDKGQAKPTNAIRIKELVHRAVPYPVLLLLKSVESVTLSLAQKRWAQNEAGKIVLDGGVVSVVLPDDAPSEAVLSAFTQALSLTSQPQTTLFGLYQGWIDSVQALLAARLTGSFKSADSPEQAAARRAALSRCREIDSQIASLRTSAAKERQMARQVAINMEIKTLQAERSAAQALL